MGLELLARFKMFMDLKSLNDWEQTTDWSLSTVGDNNSFHHTSGGSNGSIRRNILTGGKTYLVKFSAKFANPTSNFNKVKVACGTSMSTTVVTDGDYSFYLSCNAADTNFYMYADINTNVDLYNVVIEEMGYQSLDLFGDEDILLTFGIKDVKEYGQNMDTYSKEFKLPGTPKNNTFFKNIFQINEDGTFDFNQHTSASIVVDDQTIKNGIIRLENIIKVGNFYNYSLTFLGEIAGLFSDAGDTLLEELDYSDINRVIDDAWVVANNQLFGSASFPPHPEYQKFCFPYICYGYYPFEGIRGKAYDIDGSLLGGTGMLVSDLFPAIGYKYLFEKILTNYGYTYSSSTLENNSFDNMIVPFTNSEDKLNNWYKVAEVTYTGAFDEIGTEQYEFTYNGNADCSSDFFTGKFNVTDILASTDGVPSKRFYNVPGFQYCLPVLQYDEFKNFQYNVQYDIYNGTQQYYTGNIPGFYRTRKDGKYKIEIKYKVDYYLGAVPGAYNGIKIFSTRIPFGSVSWLNPNGYSSQPGGNNCVRYSVNSETCELVHTITGTTAGWVTLEAEIDCLKDDLIALKFVYANAHGGGSTWGVFNGHINYTKIYELGYGNGVEVDFKNVVPENVKVKDFLSDTLKMFNLFVQVDVDNPKKLNIESYDTFYGAGKKIDLTQKIDLGKEVKIQTPKDFSAKQLLLKYSDGDDTYNKYYNEVISERTYGHKFLKINDFNEEDEKEIKLSLFVPTPLVDFGVDANTGIRQFIYSNISTYDKLDQNVVYKQETKTKPRILFYKNEAIASSYKKFRFEGTEYSTYPYAGHLAYPMNIDDISQFDLDFQTITETQSGVPALFFTPNPTGMTNNNLYNLYWRQYLNNYIDKTARIVECYINLSLFDIQNIQLNDTIVIDDTHYLINKIIDYNCSKKGTVTKMELLKVIDTLGAFDVFENKILGRYTHDTTAVNNNLSIGRNTFAPGIGGGFAIGDGNVVSGNSFVIGSNNSASNGVIIGSNNVEANQRNIVIGSDGSLFASGVTGSVLIGSPGSTLRTANTVKIGNTIITNGSVITSGGLNDPGEDKLQVEFTNPVVNDGGENSVWGLDYMDSNILNDPND